MSANGKEAPASAPGERHALVVAAMAARLILLGFGVCRILKSDKIPKYPNWTHASLRARDFTRHEDPNIGILAGALSGNLVIVDADKPAIRAAAAAMLPRTMTDGRPSTAAAHWYFRVTAVPHWATAGPDVAGGRGGPRIMHFNDADGKPIGMDFLGTGGQVVCPPSIHHSGEKRAWLVPPEEILTLPFMELWALVKALAKDHGAVNADRENDAPRPTYTASDHAATISKRANARAAGDVYARAVAYLERCPPAIENQGGHNQTLGVARAIAWGFDLGADAAFELLQQHYNPRCQPAWSDAELAHKCEDADTKPFGKPRGYLINEDKRPDMTTGSGHQEGNGKPFDEDIRLAKQPWESFTDPHYLARLFTYGKHKHADRPRLAFFREQFWKWTSTHWEALPDTEIRSDLTAFAKRQIDQVFRLMTSKGNPKEGTEAEKLKKSASKEQSSPKVTRSLVSNILQALYLSPLQPLDDGALLDIAGPDREGRFWIKKGRGKFCRLDTWAAQWQRIHETWSMLLKLSGWRSCPLD
jgi:hypothetical protein